jgi:exonuclease SbcD
MRLLHAADFHLGLKTHGKFDAETGLNTRLLATTRCIEASVEQAVGNEVDAYLFAGDAFHTKNPSPTQIRLLINALRPLAEENIPVLMITGNHDHPVTEGKTHGIDVFSEIGGFYVSDEPEHFLLTPADIYRGLNSIETVAEDTEDYDDLTVVSTLPWPIEHKLELGDESVSSCYLSHLKRGAKLAADIGAHAVSLGHFTAEGSLPSGSEESLQLSSEEALSPPRLAATGMDYHALGHVHKPQDLGAEKDGAPVVYSGGIDRMNFGEEDQDRHAILIDTSDFPYETGQCETKQYEKLPLPATTFAKIDVDARGEEALMEAIEEAIASAGVEGAIVRFTYRLGEDQTADEGDIQELLSAAENVAGISRRREESRRQRSGGADDQASLRELLEQYAETHDADHADEIVETGLDVKKSVQEQ